MATVQLAKQTRKHNLKQVRIIRSGRPPERSVARTPSGAKSRAGVNSVWHLSDTCAQESYYKGLLKTKSPRLASSISGLEYGAVNCVYFIGIEGADCFKIGSALNADIRIKDLQVSNPFPLYFAGYISFKNRQTATKFEKVIRQYAISSGCLKLNGEWVEANEITIKRIIGEVVDIHIKDIVGQNY